MTHYPLLSDSSIVSSDRKALSDYMEKRITTTNAKTIIEKNNGFKFRDNEEFEEFAQYLGYYRNIKML